MILKRVEVSSMAVNCYIVGCEETKEVAVIDPGGNARGILKVLENNGLKAVYIINTHGHIDHIGANRAIKDATGAKVLIHKNDAKMLTNAVSNFSFMMGQQVTSPPTDQFIDEGDIIKIDIPKKTMNVDVSAEELEKRARAWKPRKPKITTGYLARYAAMVTSGSRGAVLQVPGEKE